MRWVEVEPLAEVLSGSGRPLKWSLVGEDSSLMVCGMLAVDLEGWWYSCRRLCGREESRRRSM